jgi:hypothetical protein
MKILNSKSIFSLMTTAILTTTSCLIFEPPIFAQSVPSSWSGTANNYQPPRNIGKPVHRLPGGVRGGEIIGLIPVLPEVEQYAFGVTVEAYPTFLIYIPSLNPEFKYAQFSLKDSQGNEIYKSDFLLNTSNQIVSISLPNEAGLIPLEINQDYEWSFSLSSDVLRISTTRMIGSGLIRRVELPLELRYQQPLTMTANDKWSRLTRARLYAESGIWYDSAAIFAQLYREYPDDLFIREDWERLLQSAELNYLVQKPLVSTK